MGVTPALNHRGRQIYACMLQTVVGQKKKKNPTQKPPSLSHMHCVYANTNTNACLTIKPPGAKIQRNTPTHMLYTFTVSGLSSTHMCTATILNTKHCSLDYGAACATKMNILHFC